MWFVGLSGCLENELSDGRADVGEACHSGVRCKPDLICDPSEQFKCVEKPEVGEPCPAQVCAPGGYCADDPDKPAGPPICLEAFDDGQACMGHAECKSQHCPNGFCQPMPQEGEPCPADLCAEGFYCSGGECKVP